MGFRTLGYIRYSIYLIAASSILKRDLRRGGDSWELRGIKIAGIAGDQQAALFGQTCFDTGDVKNTYGTGCFMLQNIGTKPAESKNRLLSTVGWQIGDKTEYALEGSVFIAGAVIQWLRDALGIIDAAEEVELLAGSVKDNAGVYFVPAFAGLGTPHWDQDARGIDHRAHTGHR